MNSLRVLLIEDSQDDEKLILREFKKAGFSPVYRRLQTGEELTLALQQPDWHIIISDYQMPSFNGIDALRMVKRRGVDVPFIIVSGTIGEETAVEAMRAGADDYLMKHNLQRLMPAVERALRDADNRR